MSVSGELRKWIDGFIAENHPGAQLPPDKALAKRLGCSVMSVRRVIADYVERGFLERRHGSGTRIPPDESIGNNNHHTAGELAAKDSSVEAIYNDMLKAISTGKCKQGTPLPMNKQVSLQMRVGPNTVTAAYRMLERDGYVTKVGKLYWVGGVCDSLHSNSRRECCVLSPDSPSLKTMFTSHNLSLALRKMESHLEGQGWYFNYKQYADLECLTRLWKQRKRLPDGFLVFGRDAGYITHDDFQEVYTTLAKTASHLHAPFPPILGISKAFIAHYRNCFFFSGSHTHTIRARTMARFILGHNPENLTIVLREDAHHHDLFNALRILPEIRAANNTIKLHILLLSENPDNARTTMLRTLYSHFSFDHIKARFAVKGQLIKDDFENMFRGIHSITDELVRVQERTMFVVTKDELAVEVLNWCSTNRIDIGSSILLLSYENNPHYFDYGITACISDWETDGYLMAHALIGDIPIAKTSRGFIRAHARILRRLTA